jgi:hypothetical protein
LDSGCFSRPASNTEPANCKIAAARSVYQTYQSHNAVFNAVGEVATNAATKARLRALQTYNYEFGLSAIADALPADQKVGIPPAPTGYFDGSPPIEDMMARTQKRLELLQVRLSKYEQSVSASADTDKRMYLALYLVISAVSIAGALLKVVDKLASSKPVLQSKSTA